MGATNRPRDVDRAILRRMPAIFRIGLPDFGQRRAILNTVLRMESTAEDLDVVRVAKLTEGWSGSDLRELCRTAAVHRVGDLMMSGGGQEAESLRPICTEDMMTGLAKMRESRIDCGLQNLGPPDLD